MLSVSTWMRLWGLDPKTGLPLVWKLWWPWLQIKQSTYQLNIAFHGLESNVAAHKRPVKINKDDEVIEHQVGNVADALKPVQKKAPVRSRKKAVASPAQTSIELEEKTITPNSVKKPKATARSVAALKKTPSKTPKSAAEKTIKPMGNSEAAKLESQIIASEKQSSNQSITVATEAVAKPADVKALSKVSESTTLPVIEAEQKVVARPVVAQSKQEAKRSELPSKSMATKDQLSLVLQQQIEQLNLSPNKEGLRELIRAVYAEQGEATPEQWAAWLQQNPQSLNTLHLQPMQSAGEIKLANAETLVQAKTDKPVK